MPTPHAHCLTPLALRGGGAPHPDLPAAPAALGAPPIGPRPPDVRVHYGVPYADHLDTEHFTINWEPGEATVEQAEAAGVALERAWEAYAAAGWPAPVSSEGYYLWVLLDPGLGGTGYTAEYLTDEFPEGYPVIWLNPTWASDGPFWSSLAAHELHHAVQFAMRQTWSGDGEAWWWEATAGWASWLAEPDTRAIDYTIAWYAEDAHLAAETVNSGHEYGMAAFTQHLELTRGGPEVVRAIWEAGAADPAPWVELIPAVTGVDAGALFAQFSADFANDGYGATARWADTPRLDPASGPHSAERFGARAYAPAEGGRWTAAVDEGSVLLAGPDGVAEVVALAPGEALTVTVTATSPGGATWALVPAPAAEDTGGAEGAGGDDAAADADAGGDDGAAATGSGDGGGKGGGCAAVEAPALGGALLLAAALIGARRRG